VAGSAEEMNDVKASYVRNEGDMDKVLAELKCCTLDDVQRHCDTLHGLIQSRQLTRYKAFARSAANVRKRAAKQVQLFSTVVPPTVGKGAISVAFLSVCLSVAYIANNSRTQRPSVPIVGRKVLHFRCDSRTSFKVKLSKVRVRGGRGHTVSAEPGGHTACYPPRTVRLT